MKYFLIQITLFNKRGKELVQSNEILLFDPCAMVSRQFSSGSHRETGIFPLIFFFFIFFQLTITTETYPTQTQECIKSGRSTELNETASTHLRGRLLSYRIYYYSIIHYPSFFCVSLSYFLTCKLTSKSSFLRAYRHSLSERMRKNRHRTRRRRLCARENERQILYELKVSRSFDLAA